MVVLRNVLALHDPDPKSMLLVEHLGELRRRLAICMATVFLGGIAGWWVKSAVFALLVGPIAPYKKEGVHLVLARLTDGFIINLKIAVVVGLALGLPVLLYQLWMFVAPAVDVKARRYVVPFVLLGVLLFAAGVSLGYALFPLVVRFLIGQGLGLGSNTQFLLQIGDYVAQFALVLLVFGAVFELPLVITFLAAIGLVSSHTLRTKRSYAFFAGLIAAMIITPGADWITPLVMAGVIYLLYEMSIVMVRLIHH